MGSIALVRTGISAFVRVRWRIWHAAAPLSFLVRLVGIRRISEPHILRTRLRRSSRAVVDKSSGRAAQRAAIQIQRAMLAASALGQSIIATAVIEMHCYTRNNSRLDGWQVPSSSPTASAGRQVPATQAACSPRVQPEC